MEKILETVNRDIVFSENLRGYPFEFRSTWGLFSPKCIDRGSRLLINSLEIASDSVALDLGCGYGPVGLAIAKCATDGVVHLVDKDFVAVKFAQRNAEINSAFNTRVYLSNGFDSVPDIGYDIIVSNLPAKVGNELLSIFFTDAGKFLKPGGRLYVVTISGLKEYIKRSFREIFGNYKKIKQNATHTVALAVKTGGVETAEK